MYLYLKANGSTYKSKVRDIEEEELILGLRLKGLLGQSWKTQGTSHRVLQVSDSRLLWQLFSQTNF